MASDADVILQLPGTPEKFRARVSRCFLRGGAHRGSPGRSRDASGLGAALRDCAVTSAPSAALPLARLPSANAECPAAARAPPAFRPRRRPGSCEEGRKEKGRPGPARAAEGGEVAASPHHLRVPRRNNRRFCARTELIVQRGMRAAVPPPACPLDSVPRAGWGNIQRLREVQRALVGSVALTDPEYSADRGQGTSLLMLSFFGGWYGEDAEEAGGAECRLGVSPGGTWGRGVVPLPLLTFSLLMLKALLLPDVAWLGRRADIWPSSGPVLRVVVGRGGKQGEEGARASRTPPECSPPEYDGTSTVIGWLEPAGSQFCFGQGFGGRI
ncbi:hypothetical protein J1605_013515 [Eschrichtius robustus]|uniref:Uncharacterized protein n=1 Tax=Eschrichtius robustus TaxID=9764 RepID=A0AB34GFX9_ESCRO|nr:hypothetical protein J1605_013515 [Eschrichtius robustus]